MVHPLQVMGKRHHNQILLSSATQLHRSQPQPVIHEIWGISIGESDFENPREVVEIPMVMASKPAQKWDILLRNFQDLWISYRLYSLAILIDVSIHLYHLNIDFSKHFIYCFIYIYQYIFYTFHLYSTVLIHIYIWLSYDYSLYSLKILSLFSALHMAAPLWCLNIFCRTEWWRCVLSCRSSCWGSSDHRISDRGLSRFVPWTSWQTKPQIMYLEI